MRYLLRVEAKKYSDMLADRCGIVVNDEEEDEVALIPHLDLGLESSTEDAPATTAESEIAPAPSSPPPGGASGSSAQTPDLKLALIGIPLLLQKVLKIIDEFKSNPQKHTKVVIDLLKAIKEKSITLVSKDNGIQHMFTLDKNELKHSEKKLTLTELRRLVEQFEQNSESVAANTNKFKIDPTLWSEEAMQGFEDFYLNEFRTRAKNPTLAAMDEGAFEKYCIKKFAADIKAQAHREKFLLKGEAALDPLEQKSRIRQLMEGSSKTPKGMSSQHSLPELKEHLASEFGHQTFDPKRSSMWEFYCQRRQMTLSLSIANDYDALLNRGINPASLGDQQIIRDYLRICIESDQHVESITDGKIRREIRFSIKGNDVQIVEKIINLTDEIEARLLRFGADGYEDFLRNFDPTSVEHRRFARATMKAKGLNEMVVESKGYKLWTIKENGAKGLSCIAERCPAPQVTTKIINPRLFGFDEMQVYYKHCL